MQSQKNAEGSREPDVHYTTFIRLPFPRGDFVDPPQVHWTATKNRALWRILMENPGSMDFNWEELASRFEVTIPFILRQTSWLYERQMLQVRAHMRRAGNSSAPSPTLGIAQPALGSGHAMRRIGSTEGAHAGSSSSNQAREPVNPGDDISVPSTPRLHAPSIHRNLSSSTVTQSRQYASTSPNQRTKGSFRTTAPGQRQAQLPLTTATEAAESSPSPSEESSESSSSSESSEGDGPFRSQAFRRPVQGHPARNQGRSGAIEEGDEESPAFLVFGKMEGSSKQGSESGSRPHHTGESTRRAPSHPGESGPTYETTMDSSASSVNSSAAVANPGDAAHSQRPMGPLSPRHRTEKQALSPRRKGIGRKGSDAPSAGSSKASSSFSELDDASVTQSALEEALLSNMQHGGTTSKMSTISQALKSRYI